jgi:hypothetical protein
MAGHSNRLGLANLVVTVVFHLCLWSWLSLLFLVFACASVQRNSYVPPNLTATYAEGLNDIRFWADSSPTEVATMQQRLVPASPHPSEPPSFLALSGGGSAGAFGAGLLSGWTKRGDRPSFDVATGVSAGALIAPFVFLGPAYDEELQASFSPEATSSLNPSFSPFRLIFNSSLVSNIAFKHLIDSSV